MKKLLITASSWGHLRSFHLPYLEAFRQAGWTVHIGCSAPAEEIPEVDMAFDLPFEKRMTAVENFQISRRLHKIIRRERYDLVICHTSLAAFFTRLAMLGLWRRPRVINMVHGYLFDDTTPPLKRAIYLGAERITAPVTDLILTMNRWDEEFARRHKLAREVGFVPGVGVPIHQFENWRRDTSLRRQLGVTDSDTLLIYPAEFSPRKNQEMLLTALPQLPPSVHLVLPGRGELWEDCQRRASQLGIENRVHFPGFVTDLPRWYGISDVAVSTSRSEGLPFNVMEAMASGLPVVVSAVKGHIDLVTEGETGLLFPLNDISALVSQLERLIDAPDLRQHLSLAGRVSVEAYDLQRVKPAVMMAYGQAEIPANAPTVGTR